MKKNVLSINLYCIIVVLLFAGCATSNDPLRNISKNYMDAGTALEATRITMRTLCETQAVTTEECQNFRNSYNMARNSFILTGNALIEANKKYKATNAIITEMDRKMKEVK